ncbi:MAG TPA: hypothetical protein VL475_01235, partial [Planctomycetaceae bacterium]|nr:hypothetical protein [Planctomycetaceae bacterium]
MSTRAAAHSALRGGLRPICVDHFGDVDLQSAARVVTVPAYPTGLLTAVEMLPAAPWMYTGGLENHPPIVAGISARRTLLGNGVDVLTRVRNPWWLAAQLQGAGLPALPVWPPDADPPPRDAMWVCKPRRGAGGRGIRIWEGSSPAPHEPVWFQRR